MNSRQRAFAFRPPALAMPFALVAWLLPMTASAAVLGDIDLRSYLGEPLYARIPVTASPGENLDAGCFVVARESDRNSTNRDYRITLVETRASSHLQVRGSTALNEPIVQLLLRVGCPGEAATIREYAVLLDPPPTTQLPATSQAQVNAAAAPGVAPATNGATPASTPGKAAGDGLNKTAPLQSGIVASEGRWQVYAGDSLARIAAGIYPNNRGQQAQYIAALRQLNPELSVAADDAMLTLGSQLILPDLKALSAIVARTSAMAPAPLPPAPAAKSQSAAPSGKTPAPRAEPAVKSAPKPPVARMAAPADKLPQDKPRAAEKASVPPAVAPERKPDVATKPPAAVTPAPAPRPAPRKEEAFRLRLSGVEMDLSRTRGVTEAMRSQLREKQLLLDADDQVSALLALRNTVKQLEGRLNEMQLKLSTAPSPIPPAKTVPAPPVSSPVPASAPAAVRPPPATAEMAPAPSAASLPVSTPAAVAPDVAGAMKAASGTAPVNERAIATEPAPATLPKAAPAGQVGVKAMTAPSTTTSRVISNDHLMIAAGGAALLLLAGGAWWLARRRSHSMVYRGPIPEQALSQMQAPTPAEEGFSDWASKPPIEDADSELAGLRAAFDESGTDRGPATAPPLTPELTGDANASSIATTPVDASSFDLPPMDTPLSPRAAEEAETEVAAFDLPIEPEDFAKTMKFDSASSFTDGAASLELDTTPATEVDFIVGLDEKPAEDRVRRLQYMYESYPELATNTISIDDADSVINAARLYFEEGYRDKACELLTFGVEERPQETRFWLAQFEIFRLEHMVSEFAELAAKFQLLFGHTDDWPKVRHIGHELDPANPLFAAGGRATLAGENFDPIAENWLNAPMDMTSDALAGDLRLALFAEHRIDIADFEAIPGRLAASAS
jgi:hypothetical protein